MVVLARAYDLPGGDHERVTGVQSVVPVPKTKAADALLEVRQHEELVRVAVVSQLAADRKVVEAKANHRDRRRAGRADVLVDRRPVDLAPSQPRRLRRNQRSLYFCQRFALEHGHASDYPSSWNQASSYRDGDSR